MTDLSKAAIAYSALILLANMALVYAIMGFVTEP
ncbi:hypothetical protein C8K44_1268 [Aminobacter sp. AP02]|nr:hypothetical protein C8K44_1268 [Aminobacter sp. AP02]